MMGADALHGVVTTIHPPTGATRGLAALLSTVGGLLWVVGDRKGPPAYDVTGCRFENLARQLESGFDLAVRLPVGHYTRKNVGYLEAIRAGAACIYETDDDNAPTARWAPRGESILAGEVAGSGWTNVYRYFTAERIWPRGFPLDAVVTSCSAPPAAPGPPNVVRAPIQQGLANGSPDVDAVWRLVLDRPFDFVDAPSVVLRPGAWCPFNSQSTWWWPDAFPLLYLPSYCSFRMTDIWRSFVAQRCLWELDCGVAFHAPEVVQDRNQHDLMRDFNDEIPGYQSNRAIANALEALTLELGVDAVRSNLRTCYECLVENGLLDPRELDLLAAWLDDLAALAERAPRSRADATA